MNRISVIWWQVIRRSQSEIKGILTFLISISASVLRFRAVKNRVTRICKKQVKRPILVTIYNKLMSCLMLCLLTALPVNIPILLLHKGTWFILGLHKHNSRLVEPTLYRIWILIYLLWCTAQNAGTEGKIDSTHDATHKYYPSGCWFTYLCHVGFILLCAPLFIST